MLQVRPVHRYASPAYPTRLDAESDPILLQKHLPSSWIKITHLSSLLALFLFSDGCQKASNISINPAPSATPATQAEQQYLHPPNGNAARVAPLFSHGEGRGSVGCMAVNAPVFLSEEEAIQIIAEELSPAGIHFSQQNAVWLDVKIYPSAQFKLYSTEPIPAVFNMDIADPTRHIAVEFVSLEDAHAYGGIEQARGIPSTSYKILETAQLIDQKMQKQGKGMYAGVLYDPMVYTKGDYDPNNYEAREEQARQEAYRLLRLQVKDFVDWLKGQGAI